VTPSTLPPGTLLAGKFRIERLLGAGAMGAVYAIDHELTRHKRALKLLHASAQNVPEIVRRFLNEASAAGRAGDPHLVETFDAGTLPSGEPYVVMELLAGETLGATLARERLLDPTLAAELVAQAAEGMDAAHRAGIIHRDLKPENLFVTHRDGAPFIKIMDFGVSKFATASSSGMRSTQAGVMYGSPAYMAPEQLNGELDVDGRADVFGLGVVLFECLTGGRPFEATTVPALMIKVMNGEMVPVESLRSGVPSELAGIVRRALAVDRDERFSTAHALADALGPFRASRQRENALGMATTIASGPPPALVHPSSIPPTQHVPSASAAMAPPRGRSAAAGLAAIVIMIMITIVVLRGARPPAPGGPPTASVSRPAPVVPSIPAPPSAPPITDPTSVNVAPSTTTPPPGDAKRPVAKATTRPSAVAAASASASPVTPDSTSSARSSASESLGLRTDNPFR
jgi:serine/threonine-protein kinase